MSSRSRNAPVVVSADVTSSMSVVLGNFGRVRVRRCQEGEVDSPGTGGGVDSVADRRTVTGVDEQGEDRVHDVVVQGPSPARRVRLAAASGQLDLEERALLDVGLGDVDDQVVGEYQIRER